MQLMQQPDGSMAFVPALSAANPNPFSSAQNAPVDEFEESLRIARPPPGRVFAPLPQQTQAPTPKTQKPLKTTNVLVLAKARLKEVNKELRRMKALEKERAELERLIAAAQTKPKAVVAAIKPARTAG